MNTENALSKSLENGSSKLQFETIATKDTSLHSTCDTVQSCNLRSKYRNIDGSCNNEDNPEWGKANTPYRRIAQRKHTLVHCGNPSFLDLPNARLASRVMVKRAITDEPDASNDTTVMLMTFGQVVDHDMQLTPLRDTESGQFMDCCAPANKDHVDCCPIEVPEGDLFFGIENRPDCLPFLRSKLLSIKVSTQFFVRILIPVRGLTPK